MFELRTMEEVFMPEIVLNCQNLQCPEPVIQAKRLLESEAPEQIAVIVDNEPALENVSRFLASRGYAVSHTVNGGLWRISGVCAGIPPQASSASGTGKGDKIQEKSGQEKILIIISSPVFGSGDDALGSRLMKNFLSTLPELGESLWRLVLLNGGVTLSVGSSHVIEELQRLEASGVSILVCGTCLEYFGLLAQKAVGQTTNMLDAVTSMQLADKVMRV